jgi:uncharacterized protein
MTLLRPQPPGTPAPVPSLFSAPYWEGCARGELRFLRCANCHQALADAPRICWRCHSRELNWEVSEGRGRLYSWTIVWRPQTPEFTVPYVPIIVELEEGWQLLSNLIGCEHDAVRVGLPVELELHRLTESITLPYFRPAS